MGVDISLLLERRQGGQWEPPLEIADRFSNSRADRGILRIYWWSASSSLTDVFFGEDPIVPLHRGIPEDMSPAMQKYPCFRNFGDYDPAVAPGGWHWLAGWIELSTLRLKEWPRKTVCVGGQAPARLACLFGDGCRRREELQQYALQEPALENLLDPIVDHRDKPRNWTGDGRRNLVGIPDDASVDVTWMIPLSEYADGLWDEGLSRLLDLSPAEDYRLVSCIG
jgi:hypothetical protein